MTFDNYQKQALDFEMMERPETIKADDKAMIAKVLGLVGESGEVAEKFKKIIRDKQGVISEEDKQNITKELGDILWYIAVVADYLHVPLDMVALENLDKLRDRKHRNVQRGNGDDR